MVVVGWIVGCGFGGLWVWVDQVWVVGGVSTALSGFARFGCELIRVALGCVCGMIDSVVGCSGLLCGLCHGLRLWVMSCVEVVGC